MRSGLLFHDRFFRQTRDATHRLGASTDLKVTAAIRMLADGSSAYSLVEMLCISEPLDMECMKRFISGRVECYESEWLRRPNEEEVEKTEERYRSLGFPGFIGSVDCAEWTWDAWSHWLARTVQRDG